MNSQRSWTIVEAGNRILDPFTPVKLGQLGEALQLTPSALILDLACGKGEALCQWASSYSITGLGLDVHPPFIVAARERAQELGVPAQLDFVEADASGYIADAPVDVASCMGASWISDGPLGTAELLAKSLKPGGIVLIGEPFWREVPKTQEAITGSGRGQRPGLLDALGPDREVSVRRLGPRRDGAC